MQKNEFTCSMCGGMFERVRSDEKALAESKAAWGNISEDELAIVCDDCFKIIELELQLTEILAKNVKNGDSHW